jgi:3-oxoacyl-[acyl-carrier-protein] synthase II
VAITGMGLVTPVGTGIDVAWKNIVDGVSGVGQITRFPTEGLKTTIAAEVKDFEPLNFMDKKSVKRLETFIQYAVAASKMAIEDSGVELSSDLKRDTACSLGCGLGGLKTMEDNHAIIMGGRPDRISPFFIPMMIGNMSAGIVAMELGLRGPNYLCSTACAAGTHAIGLGYQMIRDSGLPLVVCGGTESVITPLSISGFNSIKASPPETMSRSWPPGPLTWSGTALSWGRARGFSFWRRWRGPWKGAPRYTPRSWVLGHPATPSTSPPRRMTEAGRYWPWRMP